MNKKLNKIYETDASRLKGKAAGVVHPKSINEIRNIIKNSRKITTRGGGTGLVGGAIPQNGEDIVLDLSKLNHIGKFEKERNEVEVEAGVILKDLQDFLEESNLEFPINIQSHEIATIGGMIATDALGSRTIKYGKTSNWIKWIEIIDGEGNLEKKGVTELSDYSGMEGITGVIVRACLKLVNKKKRTASIIEVQSYEEAVSIVKNLKRNSEISMIEFLDKWISKELNLEEKLHMIIEYENESGSLKEEGYEKIIELLNKIYPSIIKGGYSRIEDPKILIDKFPQLMEWLEEKRIPTFSHISVGVLHPCFNEYQEKFIPEMIKFVKKLSGQASGKHGIGLLKREFVEITDQKILRNVKKRTDPLNKFNVGKVI